MRHRCAGNHLSRTTSHRDAMLKNLAASLILHERIRTTLPKARALRPAFEKLVTLARHAAKVSAPGAGSEADRRAAAIHLRRTAFARLRDPAALKKLFDVLGPRFVDRPGGYTRILKLQRRRLGDGGEQALIELVERTVVEDAPETGASAAAAAPAKSRKKKATAAAGA